MSRVSPKQIAEWTENPVTLALKGLMQAELKKTQSSKADAFHPFEPQRTQEVLAGLEGNEEILEIVLDTLSGDWDYLMEEENEPVRNNPEGE